MKNLIKTAAVVALLIGSGVAHAYLCQPGEQHCYFINSDGWVVVVGLFVVGYILFGVVKWVRQQQWGVSLLIDGEEARGTGPMVNGKPHGEWFLRFPNGMAATGPFVNGKRHGRWEERFVGGEVQTGPYVNGRKHGQWDLRTPIGVGCVTFENGTLVSTTPGPCK